MKSNFYDGDVDVQIETDLTGDQLIDWHKLRKRILVLNEKIWEKQLSWVGVKQWLNNFDGSSGLPASIERLHALYLLAQMMYFGGKETRVLLRGLYLELILVPIVNKVTQRLNTRETAAIKKEVERELSVTRFLGVGNPSESGVHLLYYFRQENRLSKESFVDAAKIFTRKSQNSAVQTVLSDPSICRYVFIDDLCGSGKTAKDYSEDLLPRIIECKPDAELHYYSLFATTHGLDQVRNHSLFRANSGAVFELDRSYKCLNDDSRYFSAMPQSIQSDKLRQVNDFYGQMIWPAHPRGWDNGQLLLAFHHNTPDNTLPIIWGDSENSINKNWFSALKRYPKID